MVMNRPTTVAIVYLIKLFIVIVFIVYNFLILRIDIETVTKLQQSAQYNPTICIFFAHERTKYFTYIEKIHPKSKNVPPLHRGDTYIILLRTCGQQ